VISASDITEALRGLGVRRNHTLVVHADVRRCLRLAGSSREQKLDTLIEGLAEAVPDGVLAMPTFTYSFCNGEVFDVAESVSTVGVLSERFRRLPGVRRTTDPIFSSAVLGRVPDAWEQDLFAVGDKDCFGARSIFAYLLEADAQHLCIDTTICTLVHHIEQREQVPYRYFKDFQGTVAHHGELSAATARYFVRPLEDAYDAAIWELADAVRARGDCRTAQLDRGPGMCLTTASAIEAAALDGLRENPEFLIQRGHPTRLAGRA
jgi:aminoglycoside 3-N-acetyltransferase